MRVVVVSPLRKLDWSFYERDHDDQAGGSQANRQEYGRDSPEETPTREAAEGNRSACLVPQADFQILPPMRGRGAGTR